MDAAQQSGCGTTRMASTMKRMNVGWSAVVAIVAAVAFMLAVIAGPSGNQPIATNQSLPTTTNTGAPLPNFDHIYLIVMENEEARSIVGNRDAPSTR